MKDPNYKYLFGPVPSRRLGRSLGVDLVPFKVCPIDCVYCEVGRTTLKTLSRQEYVPMADILDEIRRKLAEGVPIDCITLTGSGEPTLHSRIGEIILAIQKMTDIPVAVLTNGNLLFDPQVRKELLPAAMVLPSLDAGDEPTYARINRPAAEATFARLVEGLQAFRREYKGPIHLEVFLLAGLNDTDEQVGKIKAIVDGIAPDSIDVNTVTRPPAEKDARSVDVDRLRHFCQILGPKAQVIAARPLQEQAAHKTTPQAVLSLLRRRPCTADDLAKGLSASRGEIDALVGELLSAGQIARQPQQGLEYFVVVGQ